MSFPTTADGPGFRRPSWLIPKARANIRRIQIALGDLERAAVVTSKIAKRKREAAAS